MPEGEDLLGVFPKITPSLSIDSFIFLKAYLQECASC